MTTPTTKPNPEYSPREHVLEHIFEVIRDTDHGDDYQTAMDLLEWIEERTCAVEDGALIFINPDHPVTIDDFNSADRAHVMGLKRPNA